MAPADVSMDVLLEFDAAGAVQSETRIGDLLTTDRIAYGGLDLDAGNGMDWAHANAVVFDGADYLVSMRHQDAIFKVDPAAGAVVWVLGYPENWPPGLAALRLQPVGDVQWPYHQHGPHLVFDPDGTEHLLVFDNGNFEQPPWTGIPPLAEVDSQSRVVQYTIDEAARTIAQDWEFTAPDGGSLFSEAVGEAERLPNGHVLSTWGFLARLPDGTLNGAAGIGAHSVRIIELDPATLTQVDELYLSSAKADDALGWTGYRSDRIQALYGRRME